MPASQANGAFGVILRRNGVSVAEITAIKPPGLTRDTYEKTNHGSPNRWKEYGKGLKDGGEVTATINYITGNVTHNASTGILSDFVDDTGIATWDFVWPDTLGVVWTFPGIVTAFNGDTPINEQVKAEITIKVSGQPIIY